MALRWGAVALFISVAGSFGLSVYAQKKGDQPNPDPSDDTDYYFTHVAPKKLRIEKALEVGPLEAWEGSFGSQGLQGFDRGWLISRNVGYVSLSRVVGVGTVEVRGTRIALKSESGKPWGSDWPIYEVVRWGNRVYLVPPANLIDLCNDANSGKLLGCHGTWTPYLPRCGDDEKKVSGLPEVPDEFMGYLLSKPITGTMTAVSGEKSDVAVWGQQHLFSGISVTLDVGKAQKVRAGMRFYPAGKDERGRRGYVISVTDAQSELLIEPDEADKKRLLKMGSRWATSDPSYAIR